jgi:hypothetical protein
VASDFESEHQANESLERFESLAKELLKVPQAEITLISDATTRL